MKTAAGTWMALCLAVAACQSNLGEKVAEPLSPERLEYINEFKKIDTAGKGRITLEEATAYYSARFNELDKNKDGSLDAQELEPLIPIMSSKSGKALLLKLDRNSDNKLSRWEFLIITNWLFQMSSNPNELSLGDVEKNMPVSALNLPKDYTNESITRRPTDCPSKVPNQVRAPNC